MHHLLLVLEWIFGLSAATIVALILIAWTIATIRAILDGHKPTPPWVPGDVAGAEAQAAAEAYWHRCLVALDICLNVVVCFGRQGETMSTHAWRCSYHWFGKAVNYWLSWFQPNHGPEAASGDLQRSTALMSFLRKLLGVSS